MQRSLLFALFLLLCGLVGATLWLLRSDTPPPTSTTAPVRPETTDSPLVTTTAGPGPEASTTGATRQVVVASGADLLDDPEIRAGLCGFKGRVVDHKQQPVGDTGVRLYRGALDSVLPDDLDVFAAETSYTPNYIAGDTKTAADGTWQVTGVWPRAFYLLFAGIGSDAPVHQVLTKTPSPGEIIDLGDIVLPHAGVLVGTVVDDNGDPMPNALVRAADIPGTIAALFPIERIEPEGALLIREPNAPIRVVLAPPWIKKMFEHLPIPATRTDTAGRFRLVGVVPGNNMLATTVRGFLSDVKPAVQVRAGQEKDVGTIRLKRGEELTGRVLDTAGKPVVDAEVIAGSTLAVAPVDIGQQIGKTDAEGRFTGQGFAAGKVTVAARRGKGHAWVLAQPQPILGEVVVTLPTTFAVDATVALADGRPATTVRMQLLQGKAGNGAAEMHLLGILPAIDLQDRRKDVAEGRWRIENLNAGSYTLAVDAPGHATAHATFDLTDRDATVALTLTTPVAFVVAVVDAEGKPIRNATIYAEARGGQRLLEMPVRCGRTGKDGKLTIDKLTAESLRVSAEHPRWGVVHGQGKLGQELVLQMQPPGSLKGVLLENGKPPEPGKFTVSLERRRSGQEPRGPLETVPTLATAAHDGTFAVTALQPGLYRAEPIKALDTLRSPGGLFAMAQDMFMFRDMQHQEVQVVSGQTAEIILEAGEKPIEGPTATLGGTLTVDGRVGAGNMVMTFANNRRFAAKVDDRGRFDLGTVPAGDLWVQVTGGTNDMMFGNDNTLWSSNVKLTAGETRELTIEVQTTSIHGTCLGVDGTPLAGLFVQGNGRLKGEKDGNGNIWIRTTTDAEGQFHFTRIAEGTWSLDVRSSGDKPMRGQVSGIEAHAGSPVSGLRIELKAAMVVKGRVELSTLGKPQWAWLAFYRLKENDPATANGDWGDSAGVQTDTGAFQTDDLTPGRYRVQLHVQSGEDKQTQHSCDLLVVPPEGLTNVVLRPGPAITR